MKNEPANQVIIATGKRPQVESRTGLSVDLPERGTDRKAGFADPD